MIRRSPLVLAGIATALLGCSLTAPTAPATPSPLPASPAPPTETPAPTPEPAPTALPAGSGPCLAVAEADLDLYSRPSLMADIFGVFSADFPPVVIYGRTADGWLGIDPGVAQAANIGVFRLRWIPPGAPIALNGDCTSVPVEPWVPAAGVCYQMSMGPVEVHSAADPASTVSYTLGIEEFVAVKGRTGTGWLFIDGTEGNVPGVVGWIPELEMNASGPCETVPVLAP